MTQTFNLGITKEGGFLENFTYITDGKKNYFFDTISEESFNGDSVITDHYLENGYSIQDHIVHEPKRYTISGFIAEKVHNYAGEPDAQEAYEIAKKEDDLKKFALLGNLVPKFSNFVYSAINVGTFVYRKVDQLSRNIKAIKSMFNKGTNGESDKIYTNVSYNKQKGIFDEFETLRASGTNLTLYCPYGKFDNMMIEHISIGQDKSWSVSNISLELKQIRIVEVGDRTKNKDKNSNEIQKSPKQENKKVNTKDVKENTTLLRKWLKI